MTPRSEYPRPHFDRSHSWLSLNGVWDFRPGTDGHDEWPLSITVPFAWETPASGVGMHWLSSGWYRRRIDVPGEWTGQRIILHFGAVHHRASVWVNDIEIGDHTGGYVPFEFDITDALVNSSAIVVVRVDAPVDKRFIPHGKQRSIPRDDYDGCSFTPTSGIWQPVWLEARPATHITALSLRPNRSLDGITATVDVAGPHAQQAVLRLDCDGTTIEVAADADVEIPIRSPRLWSPDDPHLYHVTATLDSPDGHDLVTASTGLRSIEVRDGNLLLNGQRLYVRGVLDQGYWPHTGLTAPTDESFSNDLRLAADAGYNLVRKHLKLEDPRFLHHADRLGMLIWAEPPSTGRFRDDAVTAFEQQIPAMIARDGNHPGIVIWGLYNEEWGLDWDIPGDTAKQEAARRAYQLTKRLDPSRPAVDNSGWTHVDTDVIDWHIYDEQPTGWAAKVRALLEDRSPSFPVSIAVDKVVQKRLIARGEIPDGLPLLNSEFGGGYTSVDRAWNLHWQTQELRRHDRIAGYVWTELYDIEHETAGIYDFHRNPRDDAGHRPRDANATTVAVLDIEPIAPGIDLVVDGHTVEFTIAVSHHGPTPRDIAIATAWGPALSDTPSAAHVVSETLIVRPFTLSDPVKVTTQLPADCSAARLHILLLADDAVLSRAPIDVVRSGLLQHPPAPPRHSRTSGGDVLA